MALDRRPCHRCWNRCGPGAQCRAHPGARGNTCSQGSFGGSIDAAGRGGQVKRIIAVLLLSSSLLLVGAENDRYNDLGTKIQCPCGCTQALVKCNHVGCQYSDRMIRELKSKLVEYPKDEDVLNWFRKNYGITIVISPATHGFEGTIWWVPPVLCFFVLLLVVLLIRKWRMRSELVPVTAVTDPRLDSYRSRARQETEL